MANYEIEIKSLIGDKTKAQDLVAKMQAQDPGFSALGMHKQLNHYFMGGDLEKLGQKFPQLNIPDHVKDYSVRTRQADQKIILVVKATVDDTTSSNGTARLEFEKELPMSLEELDQAVLTCGFQYQAKWSREREDYVFKGLNVTVDKNAGYGYLAEFESVIVDQSIADETKTFIRDRMKELGIEELAQDRLARMFDYYNKHWQDYYGTDKTFVIE